MTTQKIDLNEAKRLGRIFSGKDPAPSRFEQKLKEAQLKLDAERILKEITLLPEVAAPLDKDEKPLFTRVRMFMKDVAERKIKDATTKRIYDCLRTCKANISGRKTKSYLFVFKEHFHLVEGGRYRRIQYAEALDKIQGNSEMELYYLCTDIALCRVPDLFSDFSDRKFKILLLKNEDEIILRIEVIAGITIKKYEL